MRAGKLRHLVTIQKRTLASDGGYEPHTASWSTFATVWGAPDPQSGRETTLDPQSGQEQAEVSHRWRIRYTAGVTADHRILWGSRTFDIRSVLNIDERSREMVLDTVEKL